MLFISPRFSRSHCNIFCINTFFLLQMMMTTMSLIWANSTTQRSHKVEERRRKLDGKTLLTKEMGQEGFEDDGPGLRLFPTWPNVVIDDDNRTFELPDEMKFNDGNIVTIVFYSIIMVISAIGNITVLSIILKRRRTSTSRINTMLIHLAIADLMVSHLFLISWFFMNQLSMLSCECFIIGTY